MKPLLIPLLALATALYAGCSGNDSATSASSPDVVGTTTDPEVPAALAKFNANLPKQGSALPAINGVTLAGEVIDNEWLSGKTVLLNLWFYH